MDKEKDKNELIIAYRELALQNKELIHSNSQLMKAEAKVRKLNKELEQKVNKEQQHEFEYNTLINNTKDLMWSVDRNFNLITSNKPFDDTIKLLFGNIIEKGDNALSPVFSEDQLNRYRGFYERAISGETFTEIEYNLIPQESWVEISYNPIRKGKEIIGVACHSRDITKIKKGERKIKESEEQIKAIYDASIDVIIIINEAGEIIKWDSKAENLFGWKEQEVTGTLLSETIIPHRLRKAHNRGMRHFLKTGDGPVLRKIIEVPAINKNNEEFDISLCICSSKVNDKYQFIGFIRDLTEIKNTQQQLSNVEAFNRGVLNVLSSHIAVIDISGEIVAVNEAWKTFAKENGETNLQRTAVGSNYFNVCNTATESGDVIASEVLLEMKAVMDDKKKSFYLEYPCHSPTEQRWFGMRSVKLDSEIPMIVVSHQDITERRKAEAEMLLLINNTEEAFILLNSNLQIVSFNNQFKNLYKNYFGLEIQKGDSILEYAPPERKEIIATIYKNVLDGNSEESEIIVPYLNNTTKYFSIKYTPSKDEFGNIFGVFVTAIDITEKKKAAEQKEFERRDKEALINSTDDLIWSITNDFKLIAANNSFISEIKKFTGVEIKQGQDLLNTDIYPADYIKYWKELYKRAFSGESFKMEIYTPNAPGRDESWTETSFSPIIVNEQISGIACYSRNITERKKSEEKLVFTSTALQNAVNDLNKIMNSSMDVICAVDANGIFLKVSAASETVWGYTPKELIGTPIFNIVYQEDLEKTKLSASNVMAGSNLNHFENRYVRKDGTLVPIEWTARWDEKDQIRYGVARDASEKKRLEKAVEKEKQRFYDLFTEAPSSMGVLSGPDHVFEIVNPLYLQLIGKKDIIGKTVKEVLPEAVEQGFIDLLDGVYKTGKTFSTNEMCIKLDIQGTGQLVDKYLNFMYQAHRTEKDIIDGILFFAVDVTEQVELRQKIEVSEAKLKEAQAIAHIGNWEIDMLTNFHSWSDEFFNIVGINKCEEQPSTEAFLSFIHHEDVIFVQKKMQEAFETLEASSMNFRIVPPDGTLKYGYTEWRFEFDINNKPTRLYGILQDVTDRKTTEGELEKLTNDLLQRNRDLEQLTFIISHNLRAPAANIIGFAENLQDETLTPQEHIDLLEGLSKSVSGLDTVIKDINFILQAKREVKEKKELISFSKLVNDISISIKNLIDKHHVQINPDFFEVGEIFSLKVYIHSIFFNLISNSIKYRKPDEEPIIEIKSKKEDGKIILIFKDNGLGIDMKTKGDKVFGLYNRFHSHEEGKGMGLFMVKTQIEALGGNISVESELNKGTEFKIVFKT